MMNTKRTSGWMLTSLMLTATVVFGQSQTTRPPNPPSPLPTQAQSPQPPPPQNSTQDRAIFRSSTNYVYNDIRVVDGKGQFVPDLSAREFTIYEDGVEQKMQFFQVAIGGRFSTPITLDKPLARDGLILPETPPPVDTSRRLIVIFIDDLHLQVADTAITKHVLEIMRDTLLHDGDEIAIVGTGYSGIDSYPLMYYYARSHARLDEAIHKLMGSGMTPEEIINASQTSDGPAGLRYNMDTAFRTADDVLAQMERITNRRKAFIYISSGYDLNPFQDSRLMQAQNGYDFTNAPGNPQLDSLPTTPGVASAPPGPNGIAVNPFASQIGEFSEAQLMTELAELIRAAKRADTAFYTVDPRGLVPPTAPGMTSIQPQEWAAYVDKSDSTLRALAEQTGGIAGVNTNNFKAFFQRVDADFSDYYEIGYTSSDVDPLRRTRRIEITVARPGLRVIQRRDSYSVRAEGEPAPKPKLRRIIKK